MTFKIKRLLALVLVAMMLLAGCDVTPDVSQPTQSTESVLTTEAPTTEITEAPTEQSDEIQTEANQESSDAATENATEIATESTTESTTADTTTQSTETTTENNTEAQTDAQTSESTEAQTENNSENHTQAPTEKITEEITETPTEKPTETQTERPALDLSEGPVFTSDPYVNVNKTEFYANYTPAVSASDAYYRTQHNLMSGDISAQDQAPTIAENRPMDDGQYIRNTAALYSKDGETYFVLDANGQVVNRIYKSGAYVTLEEVAAYVMAFGDIPPNYTSKKSGKPSSDPWGKYLRLNHSAFSGSTSQYPYEPELPDISGCGGSLKYYEIDIGTTGTDCDPSYDITDYNNGTKITRGAARIVYARFDKNGDKIIDPNERYVFYTYNHYNDFQEYLNYEGGWGEMFGNITGGGTLSSKYNYNPTPYVEVIRDDFTRPHARIVTIVAILPYYYDEYAFAA